MEMEKKCPYINRDDVAQMLIEGVLENNSSPQYAEYIRMLVYSVPSADVEPVVRCKDCKCWTEWSNGTGSCSRFALDWIGTDADDFCSMGERKDND